MRIIAQGELTNRNTTEPTLFDEAEVEATKPETDVTAEEAQKEEATEVKTHSVG